MSSDSRTNLSKLLSVNSITSFGSDSLDDSLDFPPSCLLTLLRTAERAASTKPCAVLAPLKSSGLYLLVPNILTVGKPLIPNRELSSLCSSALTPPTLTTP